MTTSGLSNADLFHAEDGLLKMFELRKTVGMDTKDVEDAYRVLAEELNDRDLLFKGLPEEAKPGQNATGDDDGDNDDQEGSDNNTGAGVGASEDRGKATDGAGSEKQQPKNKLKQGEGPVVVKGQNGNGMSTVPGGKKGKGGEGNRTQRGVQSGVPSGPDPDNTGETNWRKGKKAKQNKSGESNRTQDVGKGMDPSAPAPAPAPKPTPKPAASSSDADGDDDGDTYTPHPFVPSAAIASICGTCGRPIADHVGKFLGTDDSWEYAAYVVKEFRKELETTGTTDPAKTILLKRDFSDDERRQFAGNGVSLPDGSFPIPDEASLHNAIRLVGHAQDPSAAMQHIIERAKTMGMTHALPPAWNVPDAGTETETQPPGPGAHGLAPDQGAANGAGGGSGGGARPSSPNSSSPKPNASIGAGKNVSKAIAKCFDRGFKKGLDTATMLEVIDVATSPTFHQYTVLKSAESRMTMGPVYMPDQYDAHQEWTTPDELEKALHRYVAETGADRNIYLQHTDRPAGQWLEVMQWPFPVRATMQKSVDGVVKSQALDLPAGTVYMKVQWEPWSWQMVKSEKITGFSMGGWAKRVEAEIERRAA